MPEGGFALTPQTLDDISVVNLYCVHSSSAGRDVMLNYTHLQYGKLLLRSFLRCRARVFTPRGG